MGFSLLATRSRQYAIWVTCHTGTVANRGFNVETRANAQLSCNMPYLEVAQVLA
jgi:hypothetical protein